MTISIEHNRIFRYTILLHNCIFSSTFIKEREIYENISSRWCFPKGIEILQKAGFETVIKDKLPAEELLEIIPDFDGLIVRSASKVTKEVIERAKN